MVTLQEQKTKDKNKQKEKEKKKKRGAMTIAPFFYAAELSELGELEQEFISEPFEKVGYFQQKETYYRDDLINE